jgi:hypothetical protein
MDAPAVLLFVIVAMLTVDLLAIRFGVASRTPIGDDHRR